MSTGSRVSLQLLHTRLVVVRTWDSEQRGKRERGKGREIVGGRVEWSEGGVL